MLFYKKNKYGFSEYDCCKIATGKYPIARKSPEQIRAMFRELGCGVGLSDETNKKYCVFLATKLLSEEPSDQCYRTVLINDGRHRRCIVEKLAKQGIHIQLSEQKSL